MSATSRDLVSQCLRFASPERMPRHTWVLPWAELHYPEALASLRREFPDDIAQAPTFYEPSPRKQGDAYAVGQSTDEWGCVFENLQAGVIGEVREPRVAELDQTDHYDPPYELLPAKVEAWRDTVNRHCAQTSEFMLAGALPRPWERYQFLRGTMNAMIDLKVERAGFLKLLNKIHEFHLREIELWVQTDVNGIFFMDDWGAQNSLLIDPAQWREIFKPLYRDYCELAHAHGKHAFMHSDGCISSIYPDLIEVGVDALNSQLFVMDMDELARTAKGRITFWGEIDRQHILTAVDPAVVTAAIERVAEALYDPRGGIIAQFEFGPGAQPENPVRIHRAWEKVQQNRVMTSP